MKILMFMRDPAPPARADVRVLFDKCLRSHGIATDFVAPPPRNASTEKDCTTRARLFVSRASPSRALELLRFAAHCCAVAWREGARYDLVIARDLPILAAPIFLLARWRGAQALAYWMSFPMPLGDRLLARDHARAGRRLRAMVAWWRGVLAALLLRGAALPLAHRVFVQSDAMRDAEARAGVPREKLFAVPMGVDADLACTASPDDTLPAQASGPWIAYLGSLNLARRLDLLIDAMVLVLREFPTARLALIGRADTPADAHWLAEYAQRRCPDGAIVFFDARPMHAAWRAIGAAALGVSPIPPGPLHDVSSPTKAVEYLALGLPVVGNAIPDQRFVIERSGGGLVCAFTDEAFAEAICALLRDPAGARARGAQGRRWVLHERAYTTLAAQLAPQLLALRRSGAQATRAA
jgi:glycosyltransferase involved in cell wall biosynthesis